METESKNNPLKKVATIVISLAIAGGFMWLATKGMEFEKIKGYFQKANYLWVGVAVVFALLAYWFRAVRWNLLLEPMGYNISNSNSFWSLSFGYLINLTIPRFGEITRATALYGVEKVPVDKSFGTIILERVVDLLCMLLFLGLTFILKYDAIVTFYNQSGITIPFSKLLILGLIGILGLILFFVFKNKFKGIPFLGKIIGFVEGILNGISSIFRLKRPILFIIYSLAIWICYYFASYLICFALEETSGFSYADGFYLIVVGTLGMMIPASGGIGAFHFALKLGIGALFISFGKSFEEGQEVGLAYAFISHTMQLVVMIVMGVIAIPILAKNRTLKNNDINKV